VNKSGHPSPQLPGLVDHPDSRGVFLELWVIRLVGGDLPAALLLSQLLWWHQPAKDGRPKLTYERDGHRWLIRKDNAWERDTCLTAKQVRRAKSVLVTAGLVECRPFRFHGAPTSAWRPVFPALQAAHPENPDLYREGQNGSVPGGTVGFVPGGVNGFDPSGTNPSSSITTREQPLEQPSPLSGDVERLCALLADLVEANGSKRPTVTDTWRKECERMLRIDERTPEQVERAIRWCQGNPFWRANVMAMPKLREKYDQLRLAAQREREQQVGNGGHPPKGMAALEEYRRRRDERDAREETS
jgi:hypothetical protein